MIQVYGKELESLCNLIRKYGVLLDKKDFNSLRNLKEQIDCNNDSLFNNDYSKNEYYTKCFECLYFKCPLNTVKKPER